MVGCLAKSRYKGKRLVSTVTDGARLSLLTTGGLILSAKLLEGWVGGRWKGVGAGEGVELWLVCKLKKN